MGQKRRTNRRATRKATRQGGADLPLITYTPNYREVEVERKEVIQYAMHPADQKYSAIKLTLSYPKNPAQYSGQLSIVLAFDLKAFQEAGQPLDLESMKDNFSMVFLAIVYRKIVEPIGSWTSQAYGRHGFEQTLREAIILDNCGNRYVCWPPNQTELFNVLVRPNYVQWPSVVGERFKTSILPDSMIDAFIKQEEHDFEVLRPTIGNITKFSRKMNPNIIPHRKFEPTAELADYLGTLEFERPSKPNKVNSNTQTNTTNRANSNTQTNRPIGVSMNTQTNRPIGVSMNTQTNRPTRVSMNTQTNMNRNQNRANNNEMVLRSAPSGWANQVIQSAQDRDLVVNSNEETNRNPQTRRPTRVNRNTQRNASVSNNTANMQRQLRNLQNSIVLLSQQLHARSGR